MGDDTQAQRKQTRRQARRAQGLCADCGAESGEWYRCGLCRLQQRRYARRYADGPKHKAWKSAYYKRKRAEARAAKELAERDTPAVDKQG